METMGQAIVAAALLYTFAAPHLKIRRMGGIRFWSIGRIGGSIYLATAPRPAADMMPCGNDTI